MVTPTISPAPRSRSLERALVLLAAASVGLGCIQLGLVVPDSGALWAIHLLFMVVFWIYIAAGIVAWRRRPSNRMGALIVIGGFAVFAAGLANTDVPVVTEFGTVCGTAVFAVIIHLLLAFPSGRLRTALTRAVVIAGYTVSLVLQAPLYLFSADAPPALTLSDRADLVMAGAIVQRLAGLVVVIATMAILALRLVRADAAHRRVLGPLFAYGMVAVLIIPARSLLLESVFGVPALDGAVVQLIVFAGVPIAFVLGVLLGGFARTGRLEELGAWLGGAGGTRPALATALARALGDSSIQILLWMPADSTWVDASGARVALPPSTSERSSVEIELEGMRIGAIVYDVALNDDPQVVRAAGRVIAIALERERLVAELLASQDALRRSRERLLAAADRERRRIAQDLHDGIQVQLVLLALEAQQIANAQDSTPGTTEHATRLRIGIDAAAAELRQLVHDVMPSTLIERGLSAATEDLVDRMPIPTRLQLNIAEGRLPAPIESTAYFLVAEGLVNAVRHAKATRLTVRVEVVADRLLVDVVDDGIGGAVVGAGNGLPSLADRVDVVGGSLRVTSDPGEGTRLSAELPCVW